MHLFSTDQSSGASTALGKGSVIGPVTQNPVKRIHQPFERCCAVSLTLCPTTTSSTSGFLWQTHVRDERHNYTIRYYRETDKHKLVALFCIQKMCRCDCACHPTGGSIYTGKPSLMHGLLLSKRKQCSVQFSVFFLYSLIFSNHCLYIINVILLGS